jgi:hypothetical protein
MGLKFRRGTTAQKSGSLAFGEPYVNTDLGTLQIGGATGDITLGASGTGSAGQFSSISGSSIEVSGNATVGGNLTVGGQLQIGDNSSDTVNVVASLSSSLIPQTTNVFDLGSATKIWRDLYISTGSIKFVEGNTVVKSLSAATLTALEVATGSSNVSVTALNSFTSSIDTTTKNKMNADGVISGSSQITYASISSIPVGIVSGSSQTIANLPTGVVSGSTQTIANLPAGTVSGSSQVIGILSSLNTYTGSNDTTNGTQNTRLTALEASASTALATNNGQGISITNLNSATASLLIETANLETFSSSALTRLSALEVETANLETFSSSALTRLTNLEGKDISITLTGDVTGTGTITDLANVSFATTIAANSVALGTDTTGDYVASMTAGTGITVGTATGEGSTPVITNTGVTSAVAGTGVSVSAGTGAVTFSIGQAVATNSAVAFASVSATGDIVAYSGSDKRLKNNIINISDAVTKVRKLNGVTWKWNDDVNEVTKTAPTTGLIAQEVQEVLPEVVNEREDGYLGIDYSKMVGLLVEAIKEQQNQIDSLTIEIEKLKESKGL